MDLSNISIYLPKYLSSESLEELIADLRDFPGRQGEFYSYSFQDGKSIYQGDCLELLPYFKIEDGARRTVRGVVISNTCDMSLDNKRINDIRVLYAPVYSLSKYKDQLISRFGSDRSSQERIGQHLSDIRAQKLTNVFFLPKGNRVEDDLFFRFDDVISIPRSSVKFPDENRCMFSLSNYGFYILLVKLSIHFTRVFEKVDRRVGMVF